MKMRSKRVCMNIKQEKHKTAASIFVKGKALWRHKGVAKKI
jgi:hypothetical protein